MDLAQSGGSLSSTGKLVDCSFNPYLLITFGCPPPNSLRLHCGRRYSSPQAYREPEPQLLRRHDPTERIASRSKLKLLGEGEGEGEKHQQQFLLVEAEGVFVAFGGAGTTLLNFAHL